MRFTQYIIGKKKRSPRGDRGVCQKRTAYKNENFSYEKEQEGGGQKLTNLSERNFSVASLTLRKDKRKSPGGNRRGMVAHPDFSQ